MFISLWIDYQRLMETFTLFILPLLQKICICTFSINADMQFRQKNKRYNRTSYLYYTHFLINIYWHFIQKPDKIPKTHMFWGLKSIIDIPLAFLKRKFQKIISWIVPNPYFSAFSSTLLVTCLLLKNSQVFSCCFFIIKVAQTGRVRMLRTNRGRRLF